MARHVGLGPVFAFEWLTSSRRWQPYALRSLTVALLLGTMWLVWAESYVGRMGPRDVTIEQQAEVGRGFYTATVMVLLGLVGLAAPAATAGAVCLDKARGNLTLLFATDLSDAEIVLGKLAARLVPVLGMVLCSSPVLAIATLFGGIDPVGLFGAILVVLSCAVFGCSLALTLSVWGKKPHEVLMATYVFGILYVLAAPIYAGVRSLVPGLFLKLPWVPGWQDLAVYNPVFLVIAVIDSPPGMAPVRIGTHAIFFGLSLFASALLIALATWRIRTVTIRQLGSGEGASRRRVRRLSALDALKPDRLGRAGRLLLGMRRLYRRIRPEPSLDRNPVLWRECQRKRPSRWTLAIWGIYVLVCGGFSLQAIVLMVDAWGVGWNSGKDLGIFVNCLQVGSGLLLLSVSAATSLAEERQRGSLDVLLATPLPTRSIIWGKWWGTFRGVSPLLILPTAVTTALAGFSGHYGAVLLMAALILSYGAAITSLGLALATWIPRLGRAVGLTVGCYTGICIGWMFFALFLFEDGSGDGAGLASASPLFGVGAYSALIAGQGSGSDFVEQTAWTIFWTIAYLGAAIALLMATLGTFNRCLGRVDDPSFFDEDDDVPAEKPTGLVATAPLPEPARGAPGSSSAADLLGSDL
ncbi:ABC transporter permease [Tautonia sociabilis]|uniref:ABC transporter permease n=1 Tax=Tautonia sociabilis TaxID=2080755 RepID=A0A432MEZ0_9BACT|nr:ABC transporter permease [Tautonia sociabilis]RUL84319.1 ABC transporter permease [Tautonia sociabilis]